MKVTQRKKKQKREREKRKNKTKSQQKLKILKQKERRGNGEVKEEFPTRRITKKLEKLFSPGKTKKRPLWQ